MFEQLIGRSPNILDYQSYQKYAILVPYLEESGEILFEIRSHQLKRQPGEVCFPGGKIEVGESPAEAAVRETMEELLVSRNTIEIKTQLDYYIEPPELMIYPFLACLTDYQGGFQTAEVQEVFTVPFDFFLKNEPSIYQNTMEITPALDFPYQLLGRETYPWRQSTYPVLFYQYQGRVIWGITARFIHHIASLCSR